MRKTLDKMQHPVRTQYLHRLGIGGMRINLLKTTYDRPTANMFNRERMKAFVLR